MNNLFKRVLTLFAPIICIMILNGCLSPIAIQAVGGAAGGAAPQQLITRAEARGRVILSPNMRM